MADSVNITINEVVESASIYVDSSDVVNIAVTSTEEGVTLEYYDGLTGEKGDSGESAYQVAVNNGFIGTESEWLSSLVGATGATGATGAAGSKGDKGETGSKGDTGATGATGAKGDKGDTGSQGIQGIQGETGAKGDTGATGAKGDTGSQGIQGEDGVSAYLKIGYASDSSGSNFSLTPNSSLRYIAFLHTTTEISSPQASDFSGLWILRYEPVGDTASVTIDFGSSENDCITTTVSASWVKSSSILKCIVTNDENDHDSEDVAIEGIIAYTNNIIDGVSFDLIVSAKNTSWGRYIINIINS